ncbi:MAG TPA: protoporphyrinogen oxidase [Thermoguttaceae bacterium]|nr:protoporphyrinogen oxidase [Thermoguttaceae bacterium]
MEEQKNRRRRVAIIGGGISGLAAAHRLVELAPDVKIVLFEREGRLGGVLETVHEDGFQVETSADNFITTVPWGVDLCKRLGLGDDLIQTNPAHRRTFVVRRGRLHKLPDGFLMMAPTRMWPLAVTPILSPMGKLRAGLEYFIPPRKDDGDESMAGFVRRRLGREVFERLVEPLVSAVYAADMEKLSVLATLPRFRDMEREHGSLIRAMRREMRSRRRSRSESGARYSMFVTLRQGLSSMVDAIRDRLPQGAVRLRTAVERIEPCDRGWRLVVANGAAEEFDAVIVAAPGPEAARLLEPVDAELAGRLASIQYEGTAIVSAAYEREQIAHRLGGMGVVVPSIERSPILAVSFSSQKYAHRAPEGKTLLRVFVGGARCPEMAEMDADRLVPLVLGELAELLGIRGDPIYRVTSHWPRTMPQYHVGHTELVERIESAVGKLDGLELAGNAYHGVGIPNCIHTGEEAAERVLRAFSEGA